jgi:hypothetical protein
MNQPITLTAFLVSTLFLWTLRFGVEAASSPKSSKGRTSLRHGRGTLDQDIQDAAQERKLLTDLEKKFYISKPDFSYSGLQFNLDYLVSDYVEESNLEVIHGRILRAYCTLAFVYLHSDHHLYLACSTKYMTDITAQKVLMK